MKCSKESILATIKQAESFFYTDPRGEMNQVVNKLRGLAMMLSKKSEGSTVRMEFDIHHNITKGINDVNEIFRGLLKHTLDTDNFGAIKELKDTDVITELQLLTDHMMETAIHAGVKPASFAEDKMLTEEFVNQYKVLLGAKNTERWLMKLFGGQWVRKFLSEDAARDWDGGIVQKDKLWRNNRRLDNKRTAYKNVVNPVEVQVTVLTKKLASIFSSNGSEHLTATQQARFLKYYDGDLQEESRRIHDGDAFGEIKRAMADDGIHEDNIPLALKSMDGLYSSWQQLNYGVSGKLPEDYDPRNYQNTILGYIYGMGDASVKQILESGANFDALNDAQRFWLEKFGDKSEAEIAKKYPPQNGVPRIKIKKFEFRTGYVPTGKNTELESMLTTAADFKMFKSMDMLGRRFSKPEVTDSDVRESIVSDLELLRHVSSDIALYTFAQDVKFHIVMGKGKDANNEKQGEAYDLWKDAKGAGGYEMEDGMYTRYYTRILANFDKRMSGGIERNEAKSFKTMKQLALLTLGLQGTMGLADSAVNNFLQATIGRLNIISMKQWWQIEWAPSEDKASADPALNQAATEVEGLMRNKVKGRNAAFILSDVDQDLQTKTLKKGFELAEAAMSYGPFLAALPLLKSAAFLMGKNTDAFKDGFWSMTGSERIIRNFNSKILHNLVKAKYTARLAAGDPPKDMKKFVQRIYDENSYYLDKMDGVLHGEFDKQTKPFWAYSLNDAETTSQLLTGLALGQFYMFRQAGMFGMLGASAYGLGKAVSAGPKNNFGLKDNAISTVAPIIIGLDFLYEYASDMLVENPIRLSVLNTVNQMDLPLGALEFIHCMAAPALGLKVTEQQFQNMQDKIVRFGAGMIKGNRLQDEDASLYAHFSLATRLGRVANTSIEPVMLMKDMIFNGVNPESAKEYKIRMRNMYSGIGLVDQVVGGGNDMLKSILKGTYAASALMSNVKRGDENNMSIIRSNALGSYIRYLTHTGIYTVQDETKLRSNNATAYLRRSEVEQNIDNGHLSEEEGSIMRDFFRDYDAPSNHLYQGEGT